jgi:hypothetical protein
MAPVVCDLVVKSLATTAFDFTRLESQQVRLSPTFVLLCATKYSYLVPSRNFYVNYLSLLKQFKGRDQVTELFRFVVYYLLSQLSLAIVSYVMSHFPFFFCITLQVQF